MVRTEDVKPEEALGHLTCLGRTCMKWRENGELTELDFQLILQRLVNVDEQAGGLLD
ncbi:hypothetical protein [Synechococcus sp. CS-1332]|uniref:hypothetical protein n=1 Tax=Synechococcus sp. CS-1332 TaxID=2847972 RepID=UPI00223BAA79|nr:hypothetical protein [Synechococcus sp. CS-1332]MCT0206857.1 hypothetical protein [Synechococcus sp. CS-1332]